MAAKQTIGHATCPICDTGPYPVKVSETGNLYMVCPPPADGGCQAQIFPRHAHSNRLLAQRITKWTIPKEERKTWLGSEPQDDPDEADEELAEAIKDEEVEVVRPAAQSTPPGQQTRRQSAPPPPKPKVKKRPAPPKPKRGLLYWADDEE